MNLLTRLLLFLAISSLGYAETLDTILEKEAIEDVITVATGHHKVLEETAMPTTRRIGKILDWAPEKSEDQPIIQSADILWPKANLIEHCRTEEGAKVQDAKKEVLANIREVLLPSLIPTELPAKLIACKDIPTVGDRYGWIEVADKVIGKIENDAMRVEIQDDGRSIGFLIVPSVPQQEGEKADEFALRILKQVTRLPPDAKVQFWPWRAPDRGIVMFDLLPMGQRADGVGQSTLWYDHAGIYVHPKFVHIGVLGGSKRGVSFRANNRHLEYPDRF